MHTLSNNLFGPIREERGREERRGKKEGGVVYIRIRAMG